jgi:NAD(P)-dependent dehydrogenase (short-subunit alcohol dehydrogenase family)
MAVQIDLSGRVALITGAGSGIGEATAKALARAGAKVAIADVDRLGAERVAKEIEAAGGTSPSATGSPVRSSA